MHFLPNHIYHVYNQGNNRQEIFFSDKDYFIFLNLYRKLFEKNCDTIAWCLMPNHFHFMLYADVKCAAKIKQGGIIIDPITNGFRKLLSGYARIFNSRHERSGSLFRQKTKAKSLSDIKAYPGSPYQVQDYYVNCFHYIHQNVLRAKLVSRLEDWQFSSFREYAGLQIDGLCKKELAALYCNYTQEDFIERSYSLVEEKVIKLII